MANPLDAQVSLWPSAYQGANVPPSELPTLRVMLARIHDGTYASKIAHVQKVRNSAGDDAYKEAKKDLPAFIPAGMFSGRSKHRLEMHSGCVVLDYDHVADLPALTARVCADPHVVFAFRSPSGDGLKVGFRVPVLSDPDTHAWAFGIVLMYTRNAWGEAAKADEPCKDVSRLCFVGNDGDLFMREDAVEFVLPPAPKLAVPDIGEDDRRAPPEIRADVAAAVAAYNADHPRDWGVPGKGACPVCKEPGCFGNAGGRLAGAGRWACFNTDHGPVGKVFEALHHGDALDIDAFKASKDRFEFLRERGYLKERDKDGSIIGTDLWFARRIALEHGKFLKYVAPWKAWMIYAETEGRWMSDNDNTAIALAIQSANKLTEEVMEMSHDDKRRETLWKAVVYFQSRKGLNNALALAAALPDMRSTPDEWDSNPYLLNCTNGTVDLQTGRLLEHKPEHRLRGSTGIDYDPEADCERWDSFMREILPDPDVREYLNRAVGYSAIGKVSEHIIFIAWGGGSNGKGVFFNSISFALGSYACSVPPALLIHNRFPQHDTIRADLHGKRMAVASEPPEGSRFDEAQLKLLTGGDRIKARRMREDFWEFEPSHTLWLQTNHRPAVHEDTFGFWRRIRLVAFTVTFPIDKQDKQLGDKLRAEAQGILRWIVDGAVRWCEQGLVTPASVVAATEEYRAEEDPLDGFVGLYEPHDGPLLPRKTMYGDYVEWVKASSGGEPWKYQTVIKKLGDRLPTKTSRGVRGFAVRKKHDPTGDEVDRLIARNA